MAIEILMPALSPTMEEGTLSKWLVSEGDKVRSGDLLAEIETDKATMEFEAVDEGIIGKILISEGSENVKVNSTIAILLEDDEKLEQIVATPKAETTVIPSEKNVSKPNASQENAVSNKPEKRIFASPLARRIAKDKGLDLHSFSGSGPKGRIIKADLAAEPSLKSNKSAPVYTEALENSYEAGIEVIYQNRDYKKLPIQGMRKVIAERLTEAKKNIPHFYLRRDIILDDLLNVRQKINKSLEARGIKVSINDFIIKACALALQSTPTA
ncbi:MAG: biotin/lipoyl-containing protein, partial [Planktomarina sp.]|nr:biotin/lipoyl-containing protein [Planktomarina sp.]